MIKQTLLFSFVVLFGSARCAPDDFEAGSTAAEKLLKARFEGEKYIDGSFNGRLTSAETEAKHIFELDQQRTTLFRAKGVEVDRCFRDYSEALTWFKEWHNDVPWGDFNHKLLLYHVEVDIRHKGQTHEFVMYDAYLVVNRRSMVIERALGLGCNASPLEDVEVVPEVLPTTPSAPTRVRGQLHTNKVSTEPPAPKP